MLRKRRRAKFEYQYEPYFTTHDKGIGESNNSDELRTVTQANAIVFKMLPIRNHDEQCFISTTQDGSGARGTSRNYSLGGRCVVNDSCAGLAMRHTFNMQEENRRGQFFSITKLTVIEFIIYQAGS